MEMQWIFPFAEDYHINITGGEEETRSETSKVVHLSQRTTDRVKCSWRHLPTSTNVHSAGYIKYNQTVINSKNLTCRKRTFTTTLKDTENRTGNFWMEFHWVWWKGCLLYGMDHFGISRKTLKTTKLAYLLQITCRKCLAEDCHIGNFQLVSHMHTHIGADVRSTLRGLPLRFPDSDFQRPTHNRQEERKWKQFSWHSNTNSMTRKIFLKMLPFSRIFRFYNF